MNSTQPKEWPAEAYQIGSFIQDALATPYIAKLNLTAQDDLLDIGCGNGLFSKKILTQYPVHSFTGVDGSHNMIDLAKRNLAAFPNVTLQQMDVLHMDYSQAFDMVVSFWCLHWVIPIEKAFLLIHQSLKPKGRCFVIVPSVGPFTSIFNQLRALNTIKELETFVPPLVLHPYPVLQKKLSALPFHSIEVEKAIHPLVLPSKDIFRKFLEGLVFFKDQYTPQTIDRIHDEMLKLYEQECKIKYGGTYRFDSTIFIIRGSR